MNREHQYELSIKWIGNKGRGTSSYLAYDRDHTISAVGKPDIPASSDPAFHGDSQRYNPEELLVASLSSCHMLWFLHLCADNNIIITAYQDRPTGTMQETDEGGQFAEVVLHPQVTIDNLEKGPLLEALHVEAHKRCFIAGSVNFPVKVLANFDVAE